MFSTNATFFLNIFNPRLGESRDAEPVAVEGWPSTLPLPTLLGNPGDSSEVTVGTQDALDLTQAGGRAAAEEAASWAAARSWDAGRGVAAPPVGTTWTRTTRARNSSVHTP